MMGLFLENNSPSTYLNKPLNSIKKLYNEKCDISNASVREENFPFPMACRPPPPYFY